MRHGTILLLLVFMLGFQCTETAPGADPAYLEEIINWRSERVGNLTAPNGWMALAGLFWLREGANTFGSAESSDLVFPEKAPARLGVIHLQGDSVWMEIADGITVTLEDSVVTSATLTDAPQPLIFSHASLSWFLLQRGGQYGIRLRDAENENIRSFAGIDYFPIDAAWQVAAHFRPFAEPETIMVRNVLDMTLPYPTEGTLSFEKGGGTHSLTVLDGGEEEYFLIFTDATTGETTYGGGRYLYAPRADSSGLTVLDFNKAYNPPCAFTEYATCLLPPPQNHLDVAVTAGERRYGKH